jgi:isoleucyl-tRNA synthetase
MFQPFEGVPDYPKLEKEVLEFWETRQIFNKLREQTENGPRFDFQDGPITANNPMGVHHAWGRTYKDIFNRFYAMNGRKLRWQNGFDCQGLWVEVEVEKALGFKGKPDILAFGMENFSRACRERVDKYADVIAEQSKRLGMWMDWDRSYFTYDDSNIEHIWLFLKTCHEEGWLAPDYRVMPWCPRCETSLSQHESADSYKEITHRSVYLKFPLEGREDYFLVWTTTPWTLTANVALAVNPELVYVRAKTDDITVILSKGTVQTALKPGYEVIEEISGADLIGLSYSGALDDIPFQVESQAKAPRRVVAADWVGETDGTGIVHIAPGCGADDFDLGQKEGLGFIAPVTTSAHFKSECGEALAGLHALEDADKVFEEVEKRGRLYRIQRYKHSYPHCWRCASELIFFATQEWFIKADAGERPARGRLQRAAAEVTWVPEYAGKRMQDWLFNMGDWNISRKRFWGLPLPVYRSADGKHWEVIGSRAELRERAVDPAKVDALPELHRPWIDEIEIYAKDGTTVLQRIPEVGDAWLDAGIVPFSTVGFNGVKDIRMPELGITSEEAWQPADFITEMREQVRLWFFSMLFMGVALEDKAPYKTAMVYETMLDENGEKISKTKKNGVPYDEAVETVGADPMRWTFANNTLTKDIRFGYKPIHESVRKLLTLWNVYSFFVTYANLDKPTFTAEAPEVTNILDRWILARLQTCIVGVTAAVEGIEVGRIVREVDSFVEVLSNWYVRRSRRRFWKGESDTDKNEAYRTLHYVLLTLSKLVAPVMPFSAESIYRNLTGPLEGVPESVHLCPWPTVDEKLRDDALVAQVEGVLQAVSLGLSARKDSKIRARQPLSRALVQAPDAVGRAGIEAWRDTLLDELNVKEIELLDDAGDLVTYSLKANLPVVGKRFGKQVGALRQLLENASPEEAQRIGAAAKAGEDVQVELGGETVTLAPTDLLVTTQQQSGYSFASENGWSVALDTTLSEDLIDEGFARDFVRGVQQNRKDSGLEVSDRIAILLVDPSGETRLPDVLEKFGDYIQSETLADELRFVGEDYPELSEAKMGEETLRFRVEKVVGEI